MSKTKRRAQAARRAANVNQMPAVRRLLTKCPNCGQPGPHFVPPSLGDPGFFACASSAAAHAYQNEGHMVHETLAEPWRCETCGARSPGALLTRDPGERAPGQCIADHRAVAQ